MEAAEILAWVEEYPGVMVEITGGEPLPQTGVYPLMQALIDAGRPVLLETNGSLPLGGVPEGVGIIMDIKCPDSGMAAHNLPDNFALLRERSRRGCRDEIKFVLSSEADFHWARAMVEREQLTDSMPVLFSPVQPLLDPATLAQLLLDHRLHGSPAAPAPHPALAGPDQGRLSFSKKDFQPDRLRPILLETYYFKHSFLFSHPGRMPVCPLWTPPA